MHSASPLSPSTAARQASPPCEHLPPLASPPQAGMFHAYTVSAGHPAWQPVPSASGTRSSSSSSLADGPSLADRTRRTKRPADDMEDPQAGDPAIGKRERKAGGTHGTSGTPGSTPAPALTRERAQALLDSLACKEDEEFLRRVLTHTRQDSEAAAMKADGAAQQGARIDQDLRTLGQALAERWGGADMPAERFDLLATHLSHEAGYVPWPRSSDREVRGLLAGVFAATKGDATRRQAWIGRFVDAAFGPAHDQHLHHAEVGLRASVTLIRALSTPVMRGGELDCLLRHVLVPAAGLRAGDARASYDARQLQGMVASLLAALPPGEDAADAVMGRVFAQDEPFTVDERVFLASGVTEAGRQESTCAELPLGARAIAIIGLEVGRRIDLEEGVTALADMAGPRLPQLLRDLAENVRDGLSPDFLHAFGRTVMAIAQAAQGAASAGTGLVPVAKKPALSTG